MEGKKDGCFLLSVAHDTWVELLYRDCLNAETRSPFSPEGPPNPEWWEQITHIQGDREDRADFAAKLKGKSFDAVIDTQAYRKGRCRIGGGGIRWKRGAVCYGQHRIGIFGGRGRFFQALHIPRVDRGLVIN